MKYLSVFVGSKDRKLKASSDPLLPEKTEKRTFQLTLRLLS